MARTRSGNARTVRHGGQGQLLPPLRKHQPQNRRATHAAHQGRTARALRFHVRRSQIGDACLRAGRRRPDHGCLPRVGRGNDGRDGRRHARARPQERRATRTGRPATWSGANSSTAPRAPLPRTAFRCPIRICIATPSPSTPHTIRRRTAGRPGSSSTWCATRAIIRRRSIRRLAEKLAALGYGIERDGNSFKLAGIDRATCDEFSRRSEIIEAEAESALASRLPKANAMLGRCTREAKAENPRAWRSCARLE